MPHLTFEYSAAVAERADLALFAETMRDALLATGLFPPGGVRVRGRLTGPVVLAGLPANDPGAGFVDMILRIGEGRLAGARLRLTEDVYSAAEAFFAPLARDFPFALSLEVQEIDREMSEKRLNTLHDLAAAAPAR